MDWSTLTSHRAEKRAPDDGGWHLFHTVRPANLMLNPLMTTVSQAPAMDYVTYIPLG